MEGSARGELPGAMLPSTQKPCEKPTENHSEETSFERLPLDLLIEIASYLDPKDLSLGLNRTSRHLHGIIGESSYWHERMRSDSKDHYKFLKSSGRLVVDSDLRKRIYCWERINRNFRWCGARMNEKLLGEESDQVLGNFRCVEFGGRGDFLAFTARDRHCISVWNLHELLACEGKASLSTYHDHDQKITSLKSLGLQLSSAAYDGTVSIRDVNRLDGPPNQTLISAGLIQCHAWKETLLVTGTRGGTLEAFDPRMGEDPQMREKVMTSTELCHNFKIQLRDHDAVLAGWDSGVRKLKLFDFRNGEIMAETDAGSWNLSMHLGDGQLWVGADKGKIFQYDPSTLEKVQDYTASLGHRANNGFMPDASFLECVRSLIYSHGHLFSADLRQVKLHQLGKTPKLLWEEEIVFSELAYCESRCILAAAVGHTPDQIKLMYPKKDF